MVDYTLYQSSSRRSVRAIERKTKSDVPKNIAGGDIPSQRSVGTHAVSHDNDQGSAALHNPQRLIRSRKAVAKRPSRAKDVSTKSNTKTQKRAQKDHGEVSNGSYVSKRRKITSGASKVCPNAQHTQERGFTLPLSPNSTALRSENDSAALDVTPLPYAVRNEQLLTPSESVGAGESSTPGTSGRPKRRRKQPDLFGDLLSMEVAVPDSICEVIADSSSRDQLRSSPGSDIIVTPKSAHTRKGNSAKSSASRTPSRGGKANAKTAISLAPKSNVTTPAARRGDRPDIGNASSDEAEARLIPVAPLDNLGVIGPAVESSGGRLHYNVAERSEAMRPPPQQLADIQTLPEPDAVQLRLSRQLTSREPLHLKPPPQGQPEVWAESRQALCETLPYFKRPQGGCYQNDGHVYGFLFDSIGHCREYMDEDVIICRAGGGMEYDGADMVQGKDQSLREAQVQAVLNDIAHHNPLVVICGNRNEKVKCRMPHQYCVLGWYKPISVWSETTAGKGKKIWTTVKYRLERLNSHRPAWHAPAGFSSLDANSIAGKLHHEACQNCHQTFPQIFLRNWMCLNQKCDHFWKINGLDAPSGSEGLEYNPAFLLHRAERWASDDDEEEPEPSSLRPALPSFGNSFGDNLTYINTRGICCPKCGRCCSRRLFSGWMCESQGCDFQLSAAHRLIDPVVLHTPWDSAPTLVRNRHTPHVHLQMAHKFGYKVSIYTFAGIEGRFIHAAATRALVEEDNGPNDMFKGMQIEDMGLERRSFAGRKISGGRGNAMQMESRTNMGEEVQRLPETTELPPRRAREKKPEFADGDLMTAFSMNYGMPYKFVAEGASKSFESAPEAVREARRRLNWAARAFLLSTENDQDFNELLIFAYLQGQMIEYHDDGEDGLGSRIATLSLGGRAKMHMRMKAKHYIGCSKSGLMTEEQPLPGGIEFEQRLQAWEELQTLKVAGDAAAYSRRRKEIPREIGIFERRNKKADDLVTVSLSHGDIVLMEGYDIQKYLEHKVVPEDHLRFALTCRTVLEGHLKEGERPEYSVERDPKVYEGPVSAR